MPSCWNFHEPLFRRKVSAIECQALYRGMYYFDITRTAGIQQGSHIGQGIDAGQVIARLGSRECNGGWAPHLHLQLALSIQGMGLNWPGLAFPDDKALWCSLCPNPAALLNLPDNRTTYPAISESNTLVERQKNFATHLKLSYQKPLLLLRAYRHHLFDQWGRAYLDAYNNVPHVGHAHPDIQAVVARQLREEGLQDHARLVGQQLIAGLQDLQQRHKLIGDVRGMGLFIGVELVSDRKAGTPATDKAACIVNRLRDKRILTGLEGPDNNVLKIRPPLTIEPDDIDFILCALDEILSETLFS